MAVGSPLAALTSMSITARSADSSPLDGSSCAGAAEAAADENTKLATAMKAIPRRTACLCTDNTPAPSQATDTEP
jgi:hypothetical protein